jgi:CBS domain-containing protein
MSKTAEEIVSPHKVWACSETDDCRKAAQTMAEHDIGSLPVCDSRGRLEGIVTDRDICCRIVAKGKSFETPVREIMTHPAQSCRLDDDLEYIESLMRDKKIRRLPVVDDSDKLQGFISIGDLARQYPRLESEHELIEVFEAVSTPA